MVTQKYEDGFCIQRHDGCGNLLFYTTTASGHSFVESNFECEIFISKEECVAIIKSFKGFLKFYHEILPVERITTIFTGADFNDI